MKTLIIPILFAQVLTTTVNAQDTRPMADGTIAARIVAEASAELGISDETAYRLECRIASRNEGMAGTGAALVMYAPARAHLAVAFDLISVITGEVVHTGEAHTTGRNHMDEAIEAAVERISASVAPVLPHPTTPAPTNVIAREH